MTTGNHGGARPGAGRPRKSSPEFTDRLEKLGEIYEQNLIAAEYEVLMATLNKMLGMLGEDARGFGSQDLITLSTILTDRLTKNLRKRSKITPAKLRYQVLVRDSFTCQYCGRTTLKDKVQLRVDHIEPPEAGGVEELSNLITSCFDCNIGKSDTDLPNPLLEKIKAHVASK